MLTIGNFPSGRDLAQHPLQLDAIFVLERRFPGLANRLGCSRPPLQAPVGEDTLSHMYNVFGKAIDHSNALPEKGYRPVHRQPPPLGNRITKPAIFQTGSACQSD